MHECINKDNAARGEPTLTLKIGIHHGPCIAVNLNEILDYFGTAFGIMTANGKPAHSACIGFGLERIALALFRKHGFDPDRWPASVKQVLEL